MTESRLVGDAGSRPFAIDAPAVISVLAGYDYQANDPSVKIAKVDPAYDINSGQNPKVTFDGEILLSTKGYPYIGPIPNPGDRVIMRKLGDSWIIVGVVGQGLKTVNVWTQGAPAITVATAAATIVMCSIVIPDPGWPYRLAAMASAYYESEDTHTTTSTQYDLLVRAGSSTGVGISRQGLGRPDFGRQVTAGPAVNATIYNGANSAWMVLTRSGSVSTGKVLTSFGEGYSGMVVWQVPV